MPSNLANRLMHQSSYFLSRVPTTAFQTHFLPEGVLFCSFKQTQSGTQVSICVEFLSVLKVVQRVYGKEYISSIEIKTL